MGALMGGGVGLTIGFIFGSYSILRYASLSPTPLISAACLAHAPLSRGGAGPRGLLATLSQYMLSSAATFSFFLAIGSVRFSTLLFHPRSLSLFGYRVVPALTLHLGYSQRFSSA